MKILLLDADGIFVDFVQGYLHEVTWITGDRYTHQDVTDFRIEKALQLTSAEIADINEEIIQQYWCSKLDPISDAIEAIKILTDVSNVYIVTTPWRHSPTWAYERAQWIQKHLGLGDRVISTSQKHLVRGDVFVDDKAENVIKWSQANPDGIAVLWSQPWNERDEWDGERTNDWNRIMELVSDA